MNILPTNVSLLVFVIFEFIHQLLLLLELGCAFIEFGKPSQPFFVELVYLLLIIGQELFLVTHRCYLNNITYKLPFTRNKQQTASIIHLLQSYIHLQIIINQIKVIDVVFTERQESIEKPIRIQNYRSFQSPTQSYKETSERIEA